MKINIHFYFDVFTLEIHTKPDNSESLAVTVFDEENRSYISLEFVNIDEAMHFAKRVKNSSTYIDVMNKEHFMKLFAKAQYMSLFGQELNNKITGWMLYSKLKEAMGILTDDEQKRLLSIIGEKK